MPTKKTVVLPLATALATLTTAANAKVAANQPTEPGPTSADQQTAKATNIEPNTIFNAGEDLLGLLVTKNADGMTVAQHVSHVSHGSHGSHGSHVSHTSSRY
jgi:hypothetical protein